MTFFFYFTWVFWASSASPLGNIVSVIATVLHRWLGNKARNQLKLSAEVVRLGIIFRYGVPDFAFDKVMKQMYYSTVKNIFILIACLNKEILFWYAQPLSYARNKLRMPKVWRFLQAFWVEWKKSCV